MKKKAPLVIACNEEITAANDAIAGSFTVIQGGQMVVPFGDYPVIIRINGQPMRVLQRVDAQAANAMTADLGGWLKKFLVGRPIYVGHPYHPDAAIAKVIGSADRVYGSDTKSGEPGVEFWKQDGSWLLVVETIHKPNQLRVHNFKRMKEIRREAASSA